MFKVPFEITTPLHPELIERCKGGLSDHAMKMYKTELVSLDNRTLISLTGAVYNTMMKAKGLEYGTTVTGTNFSNNPWLITENVEQYVARKILQINRMVITLSKYQLDYAFLQEADFMFTNLHDDTPLMVQKIYLKSYLYHLLNIHSYGILYQMDPQYRGQALCTIYNKRSLRADFNQHGEDILYTSSQPHRARARRDYMIHNQTGTPLILANMHLHYEEDYSKRGLLDNALTDKKIFTIMGGDANHRPDTTMDQLFVGKQSTTIVYEKDEHQNPIIVSGKPVLSLHDCSGNLTSYDGICAYAPSPYKVRLQEYGGEHIILNSEGKAVFGFSEPPLNPNPRDSLPGKPYKNEKYAIKDLNEKIGDKHISTNEKLGHASHIDQLLKKREERKNKTSEKLISTLFHYKQHKESLQNAGQDTVTTIPKPQCTHRIKQ